MTYSEWQKKYGKKIADNKTSATNSAKELAEKAKKWHEKYNPPKSVSAPTKTTLKTVADATGGVFAGSSPEKKLANAKTALTGINGISRDSIVKANPTTYVNNTERVLTRNDGGTAESRTAEAKQRLAAAKEANEKQQKENERLLTIDIDAYKNRAAEMKAERERLQKQLYPVVEDKMQPGFAAKENKRDIQRRITSLNKQIGNIEADIYNAEKVNRLTGYNDLPKNEDYAAKSMFDGTDAYTGDKDKYVVASYLRLASDQYKSSILHDYINGSQYAIDAVNVYDAEVRRKSGNAGEFLRKYRMMTNDEKSRYNYLYNNKRYDEADQYLSDIEGDLNARLGQDIANGLNDVQRVALGFDAGVENFVEGTAQLFTDKVKPVSVKQNAGQAAREHLGNVGQFAYDFAQLAGNMAPSILLSSVTGVAGAALGSLSMGASAAGNAYAEMMRQTGNKHNAMAYATLVGASESALSYALSGVGKLGGKAINATKLAKNIATIDKIWARTAAQFAKSGISEGIEETLQEYLEPLFYSSIYGGDYEAPEVKDALRTFALAALSGGVFEGPSIVAGAVADSANQTAFVNDVLEAVYKSDEGMLDRLISDSVAGNNGKKAQKIATALQEKINSGKEVSGADIRKLATPAAKHNKNRVTAENLEKNKAATANMLDSYIAKHRDSKKPKTGLETAKQEMERKTEGVRRADADTMLKNPYAVEALKEYGYDPAAKDKVASVRAAIKKMATENVTGEMAVDSAIARYAKEVAADSVSVEAEPTDVTADTAETNVPTEAKFEPNMNTEENAEVIDNAEGNLHLRHGSEWNDGANPSVQLRKLEESAGRDSIREETADRPADEGTASLSFTEEVNSADVIEGGLNKVRILKDGDTEHTRKAKQYAKERGLELVLFGGDNLLVEHENRIVSAKGAIRNGKMYVRADHHKFTADQIVMHEITHDKINKGEINPQDVRNRLNEMLDPAEVQQLVDMYLEAYHGSRENEDAIFVEIICDAEAGMNEFVYTRNEESAQKLIDNTRKATAETTEANKTRGPPAESLERVGLSYDEKTESVNVTEFSQETWSKSDYVTARDEVAKEMHDLLGVSIKKAKQYIDDVNSVAAIIATDAGRLDYQNDPTGSPLAGNSEYNGISIDYNTMCPKRRTLAGTYDAIQKVLKNSVLTSNDYLEIRDMLKEKGYTVSCGLCYVEGSRTKLGEYAKIFVERYANTNPEYVPTIAEINTTDGQTMLRREHPEVMEAYEEFMNKGGVLQPGDKKVFATQNKPKLVRTSAAYDGQLLNIFKGKEDRVKAMNFDGGLRIQSFSDFEIVHLIDMMQVVMDMSRCGLSGQAYTKVIEFAQALGDTNIKINLSLIAKGVDENGNLIFDDVEGMPYKEAMKLRNEYSKNVGTVVVVFSNDQLAAALKNPDIDFVLPFHRSQWRKSQFERLGLPGKVRDFTLWQNDRITNPNTGRPVKLARIKAVTKYTNDITGETFEITGNIMPNQYWDFSKNGKANAQRYLDYINKNKMTPKFDFLLEKNGTKWVLPNNEVGNNYWKLLIDFKMYDNNGKGSPQQPVFPKFNMDYAEKMLNAYDGGHDTLPVAQDVVDEFLAKHKAGKTREVMQTNPIKTESVRARDTAYGTRSIESAESPIKVGKKSASVDNVQFSEEIETDIIDLSKDTELAQMVDGVYGAPKYKKIAAYILDALGDKDIVLSDGRIAIVDKSDAMHIANRAADKKTAQIAKIREIVEKAKLFALDNDAAHDKFNQFFYYRVFVRFGKEEFPIYLNVGRAKNDGRYHLYDITNKIRDTADRINGLGRPKPNEGYALTNGVYDNSIPQTTEKSTENAEKTDFSEEISEIQDLREENKRLRKQLAHWRNEVKVTEKPTVRREDTDKLARRLIKDYNITMSRNEVMDSVYSIANLLAKNEDMTWDAVRRFVEPLARKMVESAEVLNDSDWKNYQDMRDYLGKHKFVLSPEEASSIADFAAWKKLNRKYFGGIEIGKTNVDKIYSEMSNLWPEFFDEQRESNPADQMLTIVETMDKLKPVYENPYDFNISAATEYLADDIMDSIISPDIRRVKTYADRANEKLQRAKQKRIDDLRKRSQSANARAVRDKIIRHSAKLYNDLGTIRKDRNIPEHLRAPVAAVLEAINFESKNTVVENENGKRVIAPKGVEGDPTKRTQKFDDLKKAYKKLTKDGEIVIDPNILGINNEDGILDEVISMRDKRLDEMNVQELQKVWDVVKSMETAITNWNKAFRAAKDESISDQAHALAYENANKNYKKQFSIGGKVLELLEVDELTPEAFFHRLGKKGDELFRMLRNAQDDSIRVLAETAKFTSALVNNQDVRKLSRVVYSVRLGGKNVKMTAAQLMELYALTGREQALMHILAGGIRLDAQDVGKVTKLSTEGVITGITTEELNEAFKKLTTDQKDIVIALQKFASTKLSEYGNKATMEVYGVKKFTEEVYWPIRTHSNDIVQEQAQTENKIESVENFGMSKATKPDAKTSVKIGSAFETFADHTVQMATYYGYLAALIDLNRIRNYKVGDGTVKDIVSRVVGRGDQGAKYLGKLMADISSGAYKGDSDINLFSKIIGNYKAASVAANLRVVAQQPTAGLRALEIINPKYFVNTDKAMAGFEEAKKYAPIAQWKDWGYFETHTGRQVMDVMFNTDSPLNKVKNTTMALAGKADSMTWGMIWNACKREAADKNPGLTGDALLKKTAERFNEVIDRTQVVDGVLQRSQIMRKPGDKSKLATAFMAEPTKTLNMFLSALYDYRYAKTADAKHTASKKLWRTSASIIAAGIVNSTIISVIDAMRDDDDEKDYIERYLSNFGENVLDQFNPMGMIPWFKSVWSAIQGFGSKEIDDAAIDNITNAFKGLLTSDGKGKKSDAELIFTAIDAVAMAFGVPIKNARRTLISPARTLVRDLIKDPVISYRFDKIFLRPIGNKGHYYDIAYEAYTTDEDAYNIIKKDLMKNGFSEDDIESAMRTRTKKVFDNDAYAAQKFGGNTKLKSELTSIAKDGKLENILPDTTSPNITWKDEDDKEHSVTLNESQYKTMQSAIVDRSYGILDELTKNSKWNTLTDEQKKSAVSDAYQIARAYGKQKVSDYEASTNWVMVALENAEYADSIIAFNILKWNYDKDKNESLKQAELKQAIKDLGTSRAERAALWDAASSDKDWKKRNPYD